MKEAIFHFPTDGKPCEIEQIKSGHIHETYLITTDTGSQYILQWINQYVFPNVNAIMNNMRAISGFLMETMHGKMPMIHYLMTKEGQTYYDDGLGGAWRAYRYVDNSICLQRPDSLEDFYECARAFGHFQYALNDFPAQQLEETIPNFHNTVDRYRQLRDAIRRDEKGRRAEVGAEIDFALQREEKACRLHHMMEDGSLPTRATHNDTKINNVLMDKDTRKAICVIDLDTVMPGLSVYDFGDAIRFGASTAAEDEEDLSKIALDMDKFELFTKGFLAEVDGFLTPHEIEMLPVGMRVITCELAMRFLTDYIEGDLYFKVKSPNHNLVRARAQMKLLEDMEKKADQVQAFVNGQTKI